MQVYMLASQVDWWKMSLGTLKWSRVYRRRIATFCTLLGQQGLGFEELGLQGDQAAAQRSYRGIPLLDTGLHPCLHLLEVVHAALLLLLDLRERIT